MEKERIKKRLHKILDYAPTLKEILLTSEPIDTKRNKIREFLTNNLVATYDKDPSVSSLKWILARDVTNVFRNLMSKRNEKLSGFSLLTYLNNLLHHENPKDIQTPSPGFFAEIEHLIKGIMGKASIYSDNDPVFLKYDGVKAARLRSKDLSRMADKANQYMERYTSGLDKAVIRKRNSNKKRILKYFGATERDWKRWDWHVRHVIRDENTLKRLLMITDEEYDAVKLARENKIPFGITPYYLSLMDNELGSKTDRAVRAQVIPTLHYIKKVKEHRECGVSSMDFMLERNTSPIEGITRRYPMILILKPILTCPQICVYCQRNWEIEDVQSSNVAISKEKLDNAIQWIADTSGINEVLITGGDPMLLSNERIKYILSQLSKIKHIDRIRIGTRMFVTLPQRMTDSLLKIISAFHVPGKREITIITHFEHPYEITPQAMEAVQKFRGKGIEVGNQLVYTFYVSRKFEAADLRHKLRLAGVVPYYTFNTKGKEETDDYRVPVARLIQEQTEEARLMPGSVRTDEIVFNLPGLGKNHLRALQHHGIISILPDGRRVIEFHPWDKNIASTETYVYTDVSIYDYLKRLAKAGEKKSDYKSIWYYY